jgi:hypothetical protein
MGQGILKFYRVTVEEIEPATEERGTQAHKYLVEKKTVRLCAELDSIHLDGIVRAVYFPAETVSAGYIRGSGSLAVIS